MPLPNPYLSQLQLMGAGQPLVTVPGTNGAGPGNPGVRPTHMTWDQFLQLRRIAQALLGNAKSQMPSDGVGISGSQDPARSPLTGGSS